MHVYIYTKYFGPLLTCTGFDFDVRNKKISIIVMSDDRKMRLEKCTK
jgi:hypothetical protein